MADPSESAFRTALDISADLVNETVLESQTMSLTLQPSSSQEAATAPALEVPIEDNFADYEGGVFWGVITPRESEMRHALQIKNVTNTSALPEKVIKLPPCHSRAEQNRRNSIKQSHFKPQFQAAPVASMSAIKPGLRSPRSRISFRTKGEMGRLTPRSALKQATPAARPPFRVFASPNTPAWKINPLASSTPFIRPQSR